MLFFDHTVIQNSDEQIKDTKGGKETNQHQKAALNHFLINYDEIDFIVEKPWVFRICELIYKTVDGIQPNRYWRCSNGCYKVRLI